MVIPEILSIIRDYRLLELIQSGLFEQHYESCTEEGIALSINRLEKTAFSPNRLMHISICTFLYAKIPLVWAQFTDSI